MAALDLYARYKTLDMVSIGCYTPGWDQKVSTDLEKYKFSFRESGSVKWYVKEAIDLLHKIKADFGFQKMFISIDDSAMCRQPRRSLRTRSQGWLGRLWVRTSIPSEPPIILRP